MELIDLRNTKLQCSAGTLEIIGHLIIWLLLTIVTIGLALMVFPYYLIKFIMNHTEIIDKRNGTKIGRLKCEIGLASIIGYIILWTILSIVTMGLLYFIFLYKVYAHCINKTTFIEI
ncbi:hypothetical protein SGGMMB4_01622 [Sodalis glossinidius str. 'morsitans']|uniref:Uncharacterized protein n=1 Tax=Sodalis glossinidius (strain morsitans) TaxID=343509 RepID=A0A193QH83_SODGM|nr:DUF6693 family protein [Sodalis glossinidius]CRL44493.1 hypothetical protein SGGMMB4_01622 [Sodalis glossinidius str. 'morsitans']